VPHLTAHSLERYALDLASDAEAALVEQHLQACNDCCSWLLEIERSLRVVREALNQENAPLFATHETAKGAVGLIVRPDSGGKWIARILGPDSASETTLASPQEAERFCRTAFSEMYPGHRCTARCRFRPAEDSD
jgi:hypothetical protein